MPTEIRLWEIKDEKPVHIDRQRLDLEARIENWIRDDVGLVNDDLLIIGQQVPTAYGGSIDLLAIDHEGNLVILELKRDKTPRDIVAQILDYASWVEKLGYEEVKSIASIFLKSKTLQDEFQRRFKIPLPDVFNESHRMYVIASSLDSATERIVTYLSESHNVDINVATFAYFKTPNGEFLARSFLLDEEQVKIRAEGTSKRQPATSWPPEKLKEAFQQIPDEKLSKRLLTVMDWALNNKIFMETTAHFPGFGLRGTNKRRILSISPTAPIYAWLNEKCYPGGAEERDQLCDELKKMGMLDQNLNLQTVVDGKNLSRKLTDLSDDELQNLLDLYSKHCSG